MNVPRREKNGESAFARLAEARRRTAAVRPRWASLAGSILAGVVVGVWLWSGESGNSLGADVLSHMDGEPEALAAANGAVDPAAAARVLEQGGIRLGPEAGEVLYASNCRFRGSTVPHLVLQTQGGPVTVLVLRDEPVERPVSIAGRGFSGRIVPAGPGSIAVVGAAGADLERIAAQVRAAVEWL
jgi:hypothetical protein